MSRPKKTCSEQDAVEIAEFLLDKGIPQKKIAPVIDKSQAWVSNVKNKEPNTVIINNINIYNNYSLDEDVPQNNKENFKESDNYFNKNTKKRLCTFTK